MGIRPMMHAQTPNVIELEKGWKLVSADQVADSGAAISGESYDSAKWYPIHRMPATILEILEEDGVYPNLYYGMNLLTEVPQDLWKKDWWYRDTFQAPTGNNAAWIDFPGINYRADIWLNGTLIANNKQAAGTYSDHEFNVTALIHPGRTNVLAVKVTPEQLIRDVSGIELGDAWFDIINWKYLGYKGPLDVRTLPTTYLAGIYTAQNDSKLTDPVVVNVVISAATISSRSLTATVSSDGHPVTSGNVTFTDHGIPIGQGTVNADGIATLTDDVNDGVSFVADRNAGIWKPVTVHIAAPVKLSRPLVNTDMLLPATNRASLTVYVDATNGSSMPVQGVLKGEITRPGKPSIEVTQSVSLKPGESREAIFSPDQFPQLIVQNPDLWWPYTMGKPALYNLHLSFIEDDHPSDEESIRFGIRQVTQRRDQDNTFPDIGKGGNFYLQINGKNFLIRGAYYTPDLLYRNDPQREATAIKYVKDMGLNMLRWEGKISSEHIFDLADEAGVPVIVGWMCCNEWERWKQWDGEDQRVARESLRSQILMLRSHASAFIWADASDGLPPKELLRDYHDILAGLHWQNAVVDTVSSFAKDSDGNRLWDGIHMQGPYSWRPPSYWFSGRYGAARGSVAEQGDNENIPPYESLKKFIPPDKLWPINDFWYFHSGALKGNNQLLNVVSTLNHRYGPSSSAQEFAKKAQLGLYEDTRAHFEDFGANGWANHKMIIYFMLDTPWPSMYSHLFDYYLKPGGAYFGAKKALRPLSVVFDYYAAGNHDQANIRVVNQTADNAAGLRVRIRVYDLLGNIRYEREVKNIQVLSQEVQSVLEMPRIPDLTSTYFVRCELFAGSGTELVDNVYWQSTTLDDLGDPGNDDNPFLLSQARWADFTALNTMPKVQLDASADIHESSDGETVVIKLRNRTSHIAFFERAEVTREKDGDEVLPITYSDNYVTVFPGETVSISGNVDPHILGGGQPWVRIEGYNTADEVVSVK
jgi:exo-1,4-beta-D-glucosaminidase